VNVSRAAVAGVLGTAAMTLLFLLEPLAGLPRLAEGSILSTVMAATVAHLPIGVPGGWLVHFGVGVLLALLYAGAVRDRLPGPPVVRGTLFGGMIFVGAQLLVMPLVGAGVFSGGDASHLLGSGAGHLVYGAVVGWIVGARPGG